MLRCRDSRRLLWVALYLALLVPLVVTVLRDDAAYGDVLIYRRWVREGMAGQGWPVLDHGWVYPAGALIPMILLSGFAGSDAYIGAWVGMAAALSVLVVARLQQRGAQGRAAAWWWVLFSFALGSVGWSRLESVMVPLTVLAVLLIPRRPGIAAATLTVAGWVKLVPFLWLAPLVLSVRQRRPVVLGAGVATAAIIGPVVLLGGGRHLLSFLSAQSDRALQLESVWSTPLHVGDLLGRSPVRLFNDQLNTWELVGPTADALARSADVTLPIALVGAYAVIVRALARSSDTTAVLAQSFFVLSLVLMVVNKVGSPQFVAWPAGAVVMGLLLTDADRRREWTRPAIAMIAVAGLTQATFPLLYPSLTEGGAFVSLVLVVRNLLLVLLLVHGLRHLWREGSARPVVPSGGPA